MSKSAIYTTNVSNSTVAAGDIVPVGTTARRYGCNVRQDGNAIALCGQGYYLVDVSATVAPSAASWRRGVGHQQPRGDGREAVRCAI